MSQNSSALLRIARRIDLVSVLGGKTAAWLIVPMVLSLSYEVAARYLFNSPTLWAYDMTFMLYGSYFMLGAAYTLQRKRHIRTDSYYGGWSVRRQALVDAVCYLVMFLPLVMVFMGTGWGYFYKSFITDERFVSSPWMPVAWPFKAVLPLTGLLLALQGVSEFLKCVYALRSGEWPRDETTPSGVIV